jgi:hypothetical protein
MMTPESARPFLRHLTATLAYRAAKVLRDVPPAFAEFSNGTKARTPVQILAHLGDLMAWAVHMARGESVWQAGGSGDWNTEVRRFFDGLAALDGVLDSDSFVGSAEKLIQGPLADALTHVGQIAILRAAAGIPIRPESYARAEIVSGRVGLEQAKAGWEFEGDASARH